MQICHFEAGLDQPFFLIAGTCVIESEQMTLDTAGKLKEITSELGIPFIYKSSFDKANRSSMSSFRGLGLETGLQILEKVKQQLNVPVLTDVHEDTPLAEVAAVVDVMQTPAFLCRQTNFIQSVAAQGKPVLTHEQHALIAAMAAGVSAHPAAVDLLACGRAEGVVRVDYGGVPCQARFDWVHPHRGL